VTLKGVNDLVAHLQCWFLTFLDGAVKEVQATPIGGRFRVLHVIECVASNSRTGRTGRRDLARDLRNASGATTGKVLARHNARPVQLPKSSVKKVAVSDRWPPPLGGAMRLDGFARKLLRDRAQHIDLWIVIEQFKRGHFYVRRSVKCCAGPSLDGSAHLVDLLLQGSHFHRPILEKRHACLA
jgi:hypothetical protein